MKKSLIPFVFAAGIFGLVGWMILPTEITETLTTQQSEDAYARVYKVTFTTALATVDTVVIDNYGGRLFDISHLGATADSAITFEVHSAEATVDSIHMPISWQVSNVGSPARAIDNVTDWITVEWDSGAVGTGDGLDSLAHDVVTFVPGRYGNFKWFRILVKESDANLDATQTVTAYLRIPKPWKPLR